MIAKSIEEYYYFSEGPISPLNNIFYDFGTFFRILKTFPS